MHHHHGCCGHGRTESLADDPRFADDEFTQAAARESRARAAHAHGASLLAMMFGGVLLHCIARKVMGGRD